MQTVSSRGYLRENYRLFHSSDRRDMDFQTHCHDFHKIILCLSGHVTYIMEGKTYFLRPWDLMIIPEHQIHQSLFDSTETYERIILWINDAYLHSFSEDVLCEVFRWPLKSRCGLFRPEAASRGELLEKLLALEQNQKAVFPGHQLLADSYLVQFLLALNGLLKREGAPAEDSVRSDPRLNELLEFINRNLAEDLSVARLAGQFYISQSYLMHQFKHYTGCTLHQYVLQKRLIQAHREIQEGESVAGAALKAGFADYSTFLRAFRKMFGCLPTDLRQ